MPIRKKFNTLIAEMKTESHYRDQQEKKKQKKNFLVTIKSKEAIKHRITHNINHPTEKYYFQKCLHLTSY